jgi:23S rRNA (guanine745-N1)-methyltransferase
VPATPTLRCTVRGCGEPLACDERAARCPQGHVFDRARRGYWNLLQPQDRRSPRAGDSRAAAQARRRLAASGHLQPLFAALGEALEAGGLRPGDALLDVGCGEGSALVALARPRGWVAHGLDLSRPAVELAARLWPQATWVIANADRSLPYGDGSFDGLLSLTARPTTPEFRRVLRPGGVFLLAVPGADDLLELRQAVQGRAELRPRLERALASLGEDFTCQARRAVRWRVELGRPGLDDLLAASYRGARHRERARFVGLEPAAVTMSRDLALLRAR